jgi:pyruvate,orthophosphate dikinase
VRLLRISVCDSYALEVELRMSERESQTKWSYFFGEGRKEDKALLGGKGANLSEMTLLGLPIPQGFTATTRACVFFSKHKRWPGGLEQQLDTHMQRLESKTGQRFGEGELPLLLSVRSGAKFSMPGMMDTVLNLGLNDASVARMARASGNERWAWDSYRRFLQMYSDVVAGIHKERFRVILDQLKARAGVKQDTELRTQHLEELCALFKGVYLQQTGRAFPSDPRTQLLEAINAVFLSWDNPRAVKYRELNGLAHDLGTAVNVQAMVYGNMGDSSGTGVAFTRNPSTGA